MIKKARVITNVPATIHGRRRPQREVVRSDRRPNRTLPITAARAPNPGVDYLIGAVAVVVGLFLIGLGYAAWDLAMNVQGAAAERPLVGRCWPASTRASATGRSPVP